MVLLRAGLVVSLMFILLVVAPVSVVGGRTRLLHEEVEVSGGAESLVRGSDSSVRLRSPGFSGRKMLAEEPAREAPTEQLDKHASAVSASATVPSAETQSTSTAPAAPAARFAARFAFLFRSLAKGSSPPSTGTPSPGHN